jgi:hypothetical protein
MEHLIKNILLAHNSLNTLIILIKNETPLLSYLYFDKIIVIIWYLTQ